MTAPAKWIGTSWKMNKTLSEARLFAKALADQEFASSAPIQRFVVPPFTAAREVKQTLAQTSVMVGAQNMHWEEHGAWTGEISAPMLVDCGLDLVELGHSERRRYFGESNETVGLKVAAALRHGLIPLICVGETLAERDAGKTQSVLEAQVRGALSGVDIHQKSQPVLFAYEPVWAIGEGGLPAEPSYADCRQAEIIDIARIVLSVKVPCLYGGSVTQENCEDFITCPHIDGLFIGRAAWNVDGYIDIVERCTRQI